MAAVGGRIGDMFGCSIDCLGEGCLGRVELSSSYPIACNQGNIEPVSPL